MALAVSCARDRMISQIESLILCDDLRPSAQSVCKASTSRFLRGYLKLLDQSRYSLRDQIHLCYKKPDCRCL